MNYKRKLVTLAILIITLIASTYYFPVHMQQYSRYVYYPLQAARGYLLAQLPVSVGDVLYILGGIWALVTLVRWGYFAFHFRQRMAQLGSSVLTVINTAVFIYLFFLLGWGFNYDKAPLRISWVLGDTAQAHADPQDKPAMRLRRAKDSLRLIAFDSFLVTRLNACAPYYRPLSFRDINDRAVHYYQAYTDSRVKMHGIGIKPTMFAYFLERTAIDGYYNPFTGEGQVNSDLPAFDLPFVVCHEMAHQAGIAAEGDANLMAYAIGSLAADTAFNYSSYLNIWLYANNRLFYRDSLSAKAFKAKLNPLTLAHIDTLKQLSMKYNNTMTEYSSDIYDSYLKMQAQKEGIRSYGNVVTSAWQLEEKRREKSNTLINIP